MWRMFRLRLRAGYHANELINDLQKSLTDNHMTIEYQFLLNLNKVLNKIEQ